MQPGFDVISVKTTLLTSKELFQVYKREDNWLTTIIMIFSSTGIGIMKTEIGDNYVKSFDEITWSIISKKTND